MAWLNDGDWSAPGSPTECAEMARQLYWGFSERYEAIGKTAPSVGYWFDTPATIDTLPAKPSRGEFHFIPAGVIVSGFWGKIPTGGEPLVYMKRYVDYFNMLISSESSNYGIPRFRTGTHGLPYAEGEKFLSHVSLPIANVNSGTAYMKRMADFFETEEDGRMIQQTFFITDASPMTRMKTLLENFTYMHTVNSSSGSSVTDLSGTFTYG